MRVILFDTSDASRPELRQRTLRVIDDEQHVVLQGLVYSASGGRELCARIAAGLGATFEFVGPAEMPLRGPVESREVALQGMLF